MFYRNGGVNMRSRADDVRKRIENRKKGRERQASQVHKRLLTVDDEEKHGFDRLPTYESGPNEENHPLFRKEVFLLKLLTSACLVLVMAILFRNQAASLDPARAFVKQSLDKDFQFATVSDWYEGKFGKPLALFPVSDKKDTTNVATGQHYALPASGKILEDFDVSGQRITIETTKDAEVEAMNEGIIRFVGEKEGFGKTVIIQHADKSESWYGNLNNISVSLYEYIEKGKKVGTVTNTESGAKGAFYFAIKKDENFVDPIQVIQFE
jgi:stage IV sporulation protein FA